MPGRAEESISALSKHHSWANRTIIAVCANVKDHEALIDFGIGYGSVYKTLLHLAGAMMRWCDRIENRTLRPMPENSDRTWTFAEIRTLFFDANDDFDEITEKCVANSVDEVVIDIEGVATRIPAQIVMSYIIIHSSHHRAQLLYMLKRLEIPLPEIDVIDYYLSDHPR